MARTKKKYSNGQSRGRMPRRRHRIAQGSPGNTNQNFPLSVPRGAIPLFKSVVQAPS